MIDRDDSSDVENVGALLSLFLNRGDTLSYPRHESILSLAQDAYCSARLIQEPDPK